MAPCLQAEPSTHHLRDTPYCLLHSHHRSYSSPGKSHYPFIKEEPQGDLKHLLSATWLDSSCKRVPKEGVFCALGGECVGSEIAQVKIRCSPCSGVPGLTWHQEVAPGHTEGPEFRSSCDLRHKRIRKEVARQLRVRNNTDKVKNIRTVSNNYSFTTSHAGQCSPKQQCTPGNVSLWLSSRGWSCISWSHKVHICPHAPVKAVPGEWATSRLAPIQ